MTDFLHVLTLVGGFVAFVVGLREYRQAQHWKRAEWLAKLVEDFEKNQKISLTTMVLDWCERRVGDLTWNEEAIKSSLVVHTSVPDGHRFSYTGSTIRDCFDALLEFFVRLDGYLEDGLIDEGPTMRYFGYWLNRLAWMDQYKDVRTSMQNYISAYSDPDALSRLFALADQYEKVRLINKGHNIGGQNASNQTA